MRLDRASFAVSWAAIAAGTLASAVAGPLIFATLLARIAHLPARAGLWSSFGPLVISYAVVLLASTLLWRAAGWVDWGATLRAFSRAITNGYDHLIGSQPRLAHGPPVRRGHLHPGDILVGVHRDDRHGHLGGAPRRRHGPRGDRRPGLRRLAGGGRDGDLSWSSPVSSGGGWPGGGRREGVRRYALPGDRGHRRHHRQPDDGPDSGSRGPGDGPCRRRRVPVLSGRT